MDKLESILKTDIDSLYDFISSDSELSSIFYQNFFEISKFFLDKYLVKYDSDTDFIYKYNQLDFNMYHDKYDVLFKYFIYNNQLDVIDCSDMGITSMPFLTNVKTLICKKNNLNIIPVLPKLEYTEL